MRYLFILATLALAACGNSDDAATDGSDAADEIVEEAAEEVSESVSDFVHEPLREAREVEDVLQESADQKKAAIDEASGQ